MEPSRQYAAVLGPVSAAARELAGLMDVAKGAQFITDSVMDIVFPDHAHDEAFRGVMLRNAFDNLDTMWRIIAGHDDLSATPPFGAIAFSDTAAAIGVPLNQFERIYWVGCGLVWSLWFDAAVSHAQLRGVPLADLLAGPSMIVHAYIDGQLSSMLPRYEAAQAELTRTRESLQVSILRQAIAGTTNLDAAQVEEALRIELDGEHLAVAVRGEGGVDHEALMAHVRAAVPGTEGVQVLSCRHEVAIWLLWASHPDRLTAGLLGALRAALRSTGFRCALGPSARGLTGLGSTARDALATARLQDLLAGCADDVVSYEQLRLEGLLIAEPERAARFVSEELRELAASDPKLEVLRDTALVWLTSGSAVDASAQLGVHEHTIRNRVAQIEKVLGRPVTERRAEVLVALRLKRLLDAVDARA